MNIEQILFEASDFTSGKNIIKSIKEGNTGISPKFFDGMSKTDEANIILKFYQIIESCKTSNIDRTKAIKLILRKAKNYKNFIQYYDNFDPYISYFKNKDKKEAKEKYKDLFNNFVNGDLKDDHEFEKKVNGIFAEKTNIKDTTKEVSFIYPKDENGWEMLIPKTFAASCKYSTTKEGKTRWCTAASKHHFDYYNNKAPLYIIRNYDKDIAYQLFFTELNKYANDTNNTNIAPVIQFMDKYDTVPSVKTFSNLLKIIPEKLLEKIKIRNKTFVDVKNKISKEEEKAIPKKYRKNPIKPFKTETINKWYKESYNINSQETLRKFAFGMDFNNENIVEKLEKFFNDQNVRLSSENKIGQIDVYKKDGVQYIFIFSKRNFSYCMIYCQTLRSGENLNELGIRRITMKDVPEDLKQIVDKKYIPNSIIKRDEDFIIKRNVNYENKRLFYLNDYIIEYTKPIHVNGNSIDKIKIEAYKQRPSNSWRKSFSPNKEETEGKYFVMTFYENGYDKIFISVSETDVSDLAEQKIKDPIFFKSMNSLFPNLKSKLIKTLLNVDKKLKSEQKEKYRSSLFPSDKKKKELKDIIQKVRGNIK